MASSMINVMLVDDHAVVRAGYHRFLEKHADIRIVAEAENADQCYAGFCEFRPDVSIIDLSLPGTGGIELIRRILARDPDAGMLVFSMYDDALFALRALDAGAKGYVTKSSVAERLGGCGEACSKQKTIPQPRHNATNCTAANFSGTRSFRGAHVSRI